MICCERILCPKSVAPYRFQYNWYWTREFTYVIARGIQPMACRVYLFSNGGGGIPVLSGGTTILSEGTLTHLEVASSRGDLRLETGAPLPTGRDLRQETGLTSRRDLGPGIRDQGTPCGQTDTCKNITFPCTSYAGSNTCAFTKIWMSKAINVLVTNTQTRNIQILIWFQTLSRSHLCKRIELLDMYPAICLCLSLSRLRFLLNKFS